MAEEAPEIMNLDLNLDPVPETGMGSVSNEGLNLNEFVDSRPFNRVRDAVRSRRRRRNLRIPAETENLYVELNPSMLNLGNSNTLEAGEGSVATAEETTIDVPKACENNNGFSEVEVYEKKDNVEKGVSRSDGSFFDCNICFDLAREPVVTCCGHLFCWSCLYRWLNVHSDAKECPVCKGEVRDKTVTPIYGQGKISYEPEEDSDLKIPPRPTARRVDSWRQSIQRTAFNLPVDEMIRTIGNRFHPSRDPTLSENANAAREHAERARSVLNTFLTSRGLRREQRTAAANSVDDVDLVPSSSSSTSRGGVSSRIHSLLSSSTSRDLVSSRIHSLFLERQRQSQLRRSASSALTSAERIVDAYFRSELVERNPEQPLPVDDRDSFSSIAAVINSDSQLDNVVEIDSGVSPAASSSRRRTDVSRDVDGAPPPIRRRRLH